MITSSGLIGATRMLPSEPEKELFGAWLRRILCTHRPVKKNGSRRWNRGEKQKKKGEKKAYLRGGKGNIYKRRKGRLSKSILRERQMGRIRWRDDNVASKSKSSDKSWSEISEKDGVTTNHHLMRNKVLRKKKQTMKNTDEAALWRQHDARG